MLGDGVTSTAIMARVLKRIGMDIHAFIPDRIEDGYGISPSTIDKCIAQCNPTLIITVDCGSNSSPAVEHAATLGVDMIVTDHHEIDVELMAKPLALVNPKLCVDPELQSLAGVGVAYQLLRCMHRTGMDNDRPVCLTYDPDEYLDIVAVGTVADMVPLVGVNRHLVKAGLAMLSDTRCVGLRALMLYLKVPSPVSTTSIGFKIGPRINAAGRMGSAMLAYDLLMEDSSVIADQRVAELDDINTRRRELTDETFRTSLEIATELMDKPECVSLIVAQAKLHKGIAGIVASRLVEGFGVPTIVLSVSKHMASGSCRSVQGINLVQALKQCAPMLTTFGGHAGAAGVSLDIANLDKFRVLFNEAIAEQVDSKGLERTVVVDCEAELGMFTEETYQGLKCLEPFGMGNPEPTYLVRNVRVAAKRPIKNGHIVVFTDGVAEITTLMFGAHDIEPANLTYDIVAKFSINEFRGRRSPQLMLEEIRHAETG